MPFWDNARFVCIALVVIGHAVQRQTAGSDAALALYLVIYAFHMPAFAIISGYFSRSTPPGTRQMIRVLTDLVIPYVVFDTLWGLFEWVLTGTGDPNPTLASWTLWFLLALAIFRLVLPYLALLRWPLAWTVVISLVTGYLPNIDATFSLSRALGLLPFFTLGWWLSDRDVVARWRLLQPRSWPVIAGAVAVLAAALVGAWAFGDTWRDLSLANWTYYRDSYAALGEPVWGGGIRLCLMLLAVVLTAAMLVLVPRGEHRWTRYGTSTMYIYLLHSFALWPLREYGVIAALTPDAVWLPVLVAGSVALCFVLGSAPVRRVFRPLVEPRPAWLFADRTLLDR